MRKAIILPALLLCVTLLPTSCDSTDKQAAAKLAEAQEAYNVGDYEQAKTLADSIKVLFPKAYEVRHQSNRLIQDIELAAEQRNVAWLDSVITAKQDSLDMMKGNFTLEKDAEYQQTGNYFAPSQVVEKNLHRSYLRFQTDEAGQLSMTSIYCGNSNIHHTSVRVTAPDGSYAETPASPDSYETTDMSEHIEKADYKYGEDGGVIDFICINHDKNLKVTFKGDRQYNTVMSAADRQAAVGISSLARLLASITRADKMKEESTLKIRFIERKISERDDTAKP